MAPTPAIAEMRGPADPSPIFAALGDPIRLSLFARLSDGGDSSIAMLTAGSGLTRQAITKHLRILRDVGLVDNVRHGRESRFACRPEGLESARAYLDRVAAQWDAALLRFKLFVEEEPDKSAPA